MATVSERFLKLVDENLDLEQPADLDAPLAEINISSLDMVSFTKIVNNEFNIELPREPLFGTLREVIEHIEARTG